MGEYAGVLPEELLIFHCLEIESNVLNVGNTEGAENAPDISRASKSEIVIVEEAETSPSKNLIVLHVAAARQATSRESEETVLRSAINANQECLLPSSDEESGGLQKF